MFDTLSVSFFEGGIKHTGMNTDEGRFGIERRNGNDKVTDTRGGPANKTGHWRSHSLACTQNHIIIYHKPSL